MTTISLDEQQARALLDLSAAQGRPLTEVVREALDEYLARQGEHALPRVTGPRRHLPDAEWHARFELALSKFRAGIAKDWTPEEIETDITAAREEVRQERAARRLAAGG